MASDYDRIRADNLKEYGEGTRHLEFFGRLYSDKTHFLFELLQNAEDAGAKAVEFELLKDRLEVRHDGRPFNEADVRGICGVGEGTKSEEDLTQIGKFGIGFKSVYAYTSSPEVHSGDEHFSIKHYVRPYVAEKRELASPWTTLFVFPFDREETSGQAFREIAGRLHALNAKSLLFLRSIQEIGWESKDGHTGVYLRQTASGQDLVSRRINLIGQSGGQEEDEEWLLFERPVPAPDGALITRVEIAFRLIRDDHGSLRIARSNFPLVVFFPTQKHTGLGFIIQGPYRTTPARDNVPEHDEWNATLVKETGKLVEEALFRLRDSGLLTVDTLGTMPLRHSDFPPDSMFRPIYECVRRVLRSQPLLPGNNGDFVSADRAKLARGRGLTNLLSPEQLGDLFELSGPVYWLSSQITSERTPELHAYLVGQTTYYWQQTRGNGPLVNGIEVKPETVVRKLSETFLRKQDDSWLVRFYAFMQEQPRLWQELRQKPFVRLEDNKQVLPFREGNLPNAYLPPDHDTDFPTVKRSIADDRDAKAFLKRLGLSEPDLVDEVMQKVMPRYSNNGIAGIDAAQHAKDINKISRAIRSDSPRRATLLDALRKTPFVKSVNPMGDTAYMPPKRVYQRVTDLEVFFEGNPDAWFVDEKGFEGHLYVAE
jgi:hypothetical protein